MEMACFSLEDDDYGDMFITQSCHNSVEDKDELDNAMEQEDDLFLGVEPTDFDSPMKSIVSEKHDVNAYSDISDWEESDNNVIAKKENIR